MNLSAATPTSAKIAWVSFHPGDDSPSGAAATAGFTQAPDVEYTKLLRNAGHEVTRYVTTSTPDTNLLNSFDLVIISRSVPSGNYQTAESTALWHGLSKPTIILGGYILRGNRLGYTYGNTMVDTAGTIRLSVMDPSHPIFFGVPLDESGTMLNSYANRVTHNGRLQAGISVNIDSPIVGANLLAIVADATDPTYGGMVIAEYPPGTYMGNASGDITAAKRMVLLTGSREAGITAEAAGIFDLEPDGARLFLNAVSYMAGIPIVEPPPLISGLSPTSGTKQYYAPRGLSFQASTGDPRGIPTTNIVLVLNGTNVSSSLTITGTAQERTVKFNGLVANTDYTGTITVRDASGRESTTSLTFDTQPAYTLPAAWAYPVDAAVTAAPGMRARIVQAYDSPILANSESRAESQLRGTLIDPITGEPYPNMATPSSDNPDGSYNQQIINWSVDAGLGIEIGNFQAPQFPDEPVPGASHRVNIAAEILTYLQLSPGRYVMGVNSDDGFVVSSGFHASDRFAESLGRFDGGRGSADTVFQFDVTEAGLYPFRLLYYQGGGAGNLEWFTVDLETNEKILINHRDNPKAVRAWRQISTPERPYIASVSPNPGQTKVNVTDAITLVLQDSTAQVETASVQLSLNGQPVQANTSKVNGVTTVQYQAPGGLKGDTTYTVDLSFTDSASTQRTASYQFSTRYVPERLPVGANIVWVSFHGGDQEPSAGAVGNGFTEAPDVEYTRFLREAGHTVTRYVSTGTPDVAYLNTFDLVIISRSVPSSHYQNPENTVLWHSVTSPTIIMGGYILRANRLGYTTGNTIPDTGGTIHLQVNKPNHPIFAGIELDQSNLMVSPYASRVTYNGTLQRGISVNTSPIVAGGTVLATVNQSGDAANGGMIIGEYPAGTVMGNTAADTTAGPRLVLLSGSREQGISSEGAGIFDLENAGARLFINAVNYMAGVEGPVEIALSVSVSANGELVLAWPESGSDGYVLQSSATVLGPNWTTVAANPVVANGKRTVTLQPSGNAQFFRLVRP